MRESHDYAKIFRKLNFFTLFIISVMFFFFHTILFKNSRNYFPFPCNMIGFQ